MNRDKDLLYKRQNHIGLYMKAQKLKPGYSFKEATKKAAAVFSVSHKTICSDFAKYNKRIPVAPTHNLP